MRPRGVKCLRTLSEVHVAAGLTPTKGAVPVDLAGRLYRIGPGRFEDERGRFPHWFDGEGLITCVEFNKGTVSTLSKLVRPAETTKAELWQRGRFGRSAKGWWRSLRSLFDRDLVVNPANTALLVWQDRLLALYEGDWPTEIDPETLDTIAETSFGVIKRGFGAHPKVHRRTGALINQGFRSPWQPHLDYFSLGETGVVQTLASVPFCGSVLTHDFAVTDRYIISFCPPLFSDASAIAGRQKPTSEALHWKPEKGTQVLITSIDGSEAIVRLQTSAFFYSHTANAYEDGDQIIVHGATAADAGAMAWIASIQSDAAVLAPSTTGRMTEIRIVPRTGEISINAIADCPFDYPVIDPRLTGRRHRFIYGVGFRDEGKAYDDLFDCVLRLDTFEGTVVKCDFGDGHYVSEPIFVPHSANCDADHGWLVCLNYDANSDESYVAIIDASAMTDIAIVPLGRALPMSFHGIWLERAGLKS